jgi:hypothetical protein
MFMGLPDPHPEALVASKDPDADSDPAPDSFFFS